MSKSKSVESDFVHAWLDRYILYKELKPPTVKEFVETFGKESPVYKQARGILKDKWKEAKNEANIGIIFT